MIDKLVMTLQLICRKYKWPVLIVTAVVLIIWPQIYQDEYYKSIIVRIVIYVLLASALNIINGFTGQFILGQAGLICVGAYTSAMLSTRTGAPFLVCLLASGVFAAVFGFLICLPTFKLRGIYLSIVTAGFAEMIRLVCLNWNDFTGGPMGIKAIPAPEIFGFTFSSTNSFYYLTLVITVAAIFIINRVLKSRVGRSWLSIKEDQLAASSLGVEISKYKAIAFTMGAFFSGIGGSLIAYFYRYIASDMFAMDESFNIISMMIVGGSGIIAGPPVGAVVVGILNEAFRFAESYRVVLYAAIVVAMMWWRPQGLLGISPGKGMETKERRKSKETEGVRDKTEKGGKI